MKIINVIILVIIPISNLAQNAPCGFDHHMQERLSNRPELIAVMFDWYNNYAQVSDTMNAQRARVAEPGVIKIPTVVHFVGSGFTIPNSIDIIGVVDETLNRANQCLRNQTGTVGAGSGVDTIFNYAGQR